MSADLADFLLARYAEDEERARKRMHRAQQNHLLLQDPKYLGRVIPGWHEWPEIEADAARVLAECDAKRQIAEEFIRLADLPAEATNMGYAMGLLWTIRLLAQPYADHPEYRDEWRP